MQASISRAIPEETAAALARLVASLAVVLLALSVATQGSHLSFQFIRSPEDYAAAVLERGIWLRVELWIDYLFLCLYSAMFVGMQGVLLRWSAATNPQAWLGFLVGSAVLDAIENAHVLAMLSATEHGLPITQAAMTLQALVGQVKLTMNCVGLLMLSFALPDCTLLERMLILFLRWVQAPLGIATLTMPLLVARPFALLRVVGFIGALWLFAAVAKARRAMP